MKLHLVVLQTPRGDVWGAAVLEDGQAVHYPRPLTHHGNLIDACVPPAVAAHYGVPSKKEQHG